MHQIAAHVPDCAACRRRLATFERIASDLARRPTLAPGNRIVNGVMAQIAAEEHSPMARPKRSLQRGIGALSVVALIAAFAVIFTLVLHGRPAASSTSKISSTNSTAPTATASSTSTFTPIVSITQAWGANAGKTITPQIDSQHYYLSGDISADGSIIFGDTLTIASPSAGGVTSIPGAYSVATGHFAPYAVPTEKNTMGSSTGCCQASATFAIISQNTEPGTFSNLLGPTLGLQDSVMDFDWPYLVYNVSNNTYSVNGPSQVTARDLRTGAETVIHAPTGNGAAFAQPFATHPGTPLPTPTPPAAYTGILGGAITGDTFFFMSQTPAATQLYEIDHLMTPGAPANVIATLPNHHDGTQFGAVLANDRLVLIISSQQNSDATTKGQELAFDRVQNRFVDLFDYSPANGYDNVSLTGPALMLSNEPATGQTSNTDIIFDTATLPAT
jgi:hypothetical protein